MFESIISKNINDINKYIVRGFFETKNIYLNDNESETLTNIIKDNWRDLYHKNYNNAFLKLKQVVNKENYEKILNYYLSLKI